jgi:hypothetical protein
LAIALYALRPILSVASYSGTGADGSWGAKAIVAVTGSDISDVSVKCVTNKVIFEDKFTLDFIRFATVEEYSVGRVKAGESFTAQCLFAWSMTEKDGQGMLVLGDPRPWRPIPKLGVTYKYLNGTPVITSPVPAAVYPGFGDTISVRHYKLTGVDGTFVIRYRSRIPPFRQSSSVHMIEGPFGTDTVTTWRIAPAGEPVIPDPPPQDDGWKLTLKYDGSAEFGVTMKGGTYVHGK